jgi:hypothetical protein
MLSQTLPILRPSARCQITETNDHAVHGLLILLCMRVIGLLLASSSLHQLGVILTRVVTKENDL